ncbi:MAG: type III secretion system chaperone [Lentisphaerae bacterium]|nr:type III secretion system chaperone [Lentisphaerota bacterium]
MTYEELIEETGAMIGIEGFTPDADGICVLASDIGEIVIMDCREDPRGLVLLNAAVADVPPEAGPALLEALKANRGFRDTKGSTLSVDPETRRFELSRYAFLEGLEPDRFVAIIEAFATALVDVRAKIEGAQLSGDPDDVSESLGMEQFMRV